MLRAYCSFLRISFLRAFPNYSATSLLYTEAIKRLNAIIGHELDDTVKMAIISAVLKYPKYIACDPLTKSEIAVPVTRHNKLIAVLDVDSTEFNSFNEIDKSYRELIVRRYFED